MRHPCPIARVLFAALTLTVAPSDGARAQPADPLPILDERGGASRLHPEPGALGPAPTVTRRAPDPEPEPGPEAPRESLMGVYSRFVSIPDAILSAFYTDHPSVDGVAAGVTFVTGRRLDYQIAVEVDWMRLSFPDGNWRLTGTPTFGATYAEIDLDILSVDVAYRGFVPFGSGTFALHYGAGLGLAALIGPARTAEVLPTCEEPVATCPHWRQVTYDDAEVPRVLPVLHLFSGLQVELGAEGVLRLDVGLRNVPYVGLTGAVRL